MTSTGPPMTMERQLREMNEALLVSSVRQHELTEKAEKAEGALRETELAARQLAEELETIYRTSPVGMLQLDRELRYVRINDVLAEMNGIPAGDHIGRTVREIVPDIADKIEPAFRRVLETGEPVVDFELTAETPAQPGVQRTWLESWYPQRSADGHIVGLNVQAQDITERKLAESLIQCQKQSLEMLVKGEQLEQVLDFLARSMESQSQGGFLVAIHLLEADGHHFGHVTAPSLPASYAQATKEMDARLQLGPCSSAVVSHEPTVVRDFAAQTRWPAFSTEAISLGLRGCFTTPIFSTDQRILGTFAIYYREPRDPSPNDRQLVDIVTHTVAIAIERKQAEQALREAEERFRHLADNIPQLAWIADAGTDGQVRWFNQNWFEYTGTTLEEMKGQGWHAVHHPDHAERVIQKFAHHVQEGLDWEDTFPLRGKDGSFRWFLSRMKVIRDESGAVVRIFGTNTDVTAQRQMADELRQVAADLSEADRRKNEFLAMLAHELRNPLAPIRNALQILQLTGNDGKAVSLASAMMERQVGQMVRLVDDLLDISRISRGKIELKRGRIELASSVHHAVEATRSLYKGMGHELTVTLPPQPIYLHADPTRLAQIVGNLLNNACKFTDRGGRIWLTVEVPFSREREASADAGALAMGSRLNEVTIRVRDSGIGIAADHLPHIFDMFTQVDTSLERSVSGLGIGLTLVKNLAELHGGTVEVHSAGVGQGSEFVVRLPLWKDEVGRMKDESSQAPSDSSFILHPSSFPPMLHPSAKRILVVDDNRDSATSLAMLLKLGGHETHTAYDGVEAVDAAAKFTPEVILLDIGLPKLNGHEAARRIREQPWGKKMVLVALTGWGQDEDKQKSKNAGFNAHMVKPVDLDALTKLLGELPAAEK